MKRYTFQALVTLHDGGDGDPGATLGSAPRRMVLRGRNEESGRSQIFTAPVSCDDKKPFRPDCPRLLATLRLAGDDVTDYLSIGGHFDLWLGNTVGDGIVTRGSSSDRAAARIVAARSTTRRARPYTSRTMRPAHVRTCPRRRG